MLVSSHECSSENCRFHRFTSLTEYLCDPQGCGSNQDKPHVHPTCKPERMAKLGSSRKKVAKPKSFRLARARRWTDSRRSVTAWMHLLDWTINLLTDYEPHRLFENRAIKSEGMELTVFTARIHIGWQTVHEIGIDVFAQIAFVKVSVIDAANDRPEPQSDKLANYNNSPESRFQIGNNPRKPRLARLSSRQRFRSSRKMSPNANLVMPCALYASSRSVSFCKYSSFELRWLTNIFWSGSPIAFACFSSSCKRTPAWTRAENVRCRW